MVPGEQVKTECVWVSAECAGLLLQDMLPHILQSQRWGLGFWVYQFVKVLYCKFKRTPTLENLHMVVFWVRHALLT